MKQTSSAKNFWDNQGTRFLIESIVSGVNWEDRV